jgi:hypothetical protein
MSRRLFNRETEVPEAPGAPVTSEGEPVALPEEGAPVVVAPEAAPIEVIGLDAYLVGKYGARRDVYAGFLSHVLAKGLGDARRPVADWDTELERFTTRVIPSV